MLAFVTRIMDRFADAALLEMGVPVAAPVVERDRLHESLEENLIEVAFAEAADYDDIHTAIMREHRAACHV